MLLLKWLKLLLLIWLKRTKPTEILNRLKRHLPWRSLTVVFVVAVVIAVVKLSEPVFWPGGVGLSKGESVATKTVESVGKNAQGQITKTVETTKIDDGKTLWDWLSVLGVPFSLAILGYWLQQVQQKRSEDLAKEQRELAADETKEEVLQVYFDRLSVLLVDKNLLAIAAKVHATETQGTESQPQIRATAEERELLDSAVDVIRARTLSILRRFEKDPERKTSVIRFLIEADIVSKLELNLSGANLSDAILGGANLSRANLSRAELSNANLHGANLSNANLHGANLHGANLSDANLSDVNLSDANLSRAELSLANLNSAQLGRANLSRAKLSRAKLSRAKLSRAELRDADLGGANLSDAELSGANLSGANLSFANLSDADLGDAELSGAQLGHANLNGANLRGAKLGHANLHSADLRGASLNGASLFATDLRQAQGLTQQQLEGENPPLLCNVALPKSITVNKDRDCDRLPQELLKRFPETLKTLDNAKQYVNELRKMKWE